MDQPKVCPFCGEDPITFIHLEGKVLGYPVISANISCEKCKFVLSFQMTHDMVTGMTNFESMDRGMNHLIAQWNERAILGKQFTADEVATILAITGKNDTKKFKWGGIIQYSPSEVKKILSNWKEGGEP